MDLSLLAGEFSICRLNPGCEIPDWSSGPGFYSISRTGSELSVICLSERVPEGIEKETRWRAIQVEGPLAFDQIGVLAGLLNPLADAQIPILTVSTYETDYVFVKSGVLSKTLRVLRKAGYQVAQPA